MKFTAGYGMALMSYVQFFYMCDFAEQVEVFFLKTISFYVVAVYFYISILPHFTIQ